MDTMERNRIIDNALRRRYHRDHREKLQKLLNERQIPYLLPNSGVELRKSIASGSFGIVDVVWYKKKLYAHKRPLADTPELRNCILDEAIKLSEIKEYHPNIQRLSFINLESLGFLMDYCDCGALDKFITNETSKYTLINALNWSYQLADALSFLHSKNIMHRDVKMQNILLKDNYQNIVLTDYGTATNLGRNLLTKNVGTPITMAPEVFRSTIYAEQCDIYSWSIVFWQLLAKKFSPYEDQNIIKYDEKPDGRQKGVEIYETPILVMKVFTDKLRPPKLNNCSKLFVALLYRSWHSNPTERPSLSFIKMILRLILNILPKTPHECSSEVIDQVRRQCTNESNTLEKYFPHQPRLNNEQSKNIYEEHSNKLKFISDMKQEIVQLDEQVQVISEQNKSKRDHHKQLLEENQILREQIQQLRTSKAT